MLTKKLMHGAVLTVAAVAAGFAGTSASAGGCGYSGGYSGGGYHGGGGYSDCSYTYRTPARRTSRTSTHHDHVTDRRHGDHNHVTTVHHDVRQHGNHQHVEERVTHHTEPAGYYRRVYRAPVYRTYYDDCGYPYRVQVRAGYYERVWVSHR
ncbi:hypothetical protein OT109_05485 [Phycisphaeraceae bacterium D3-23]